MKNCNKGEGNMFYFIGFVGAAVYFVSKATTFWMGVIGLLKAAVWPAYLIYGALKYLGI